MSRKAQAFWEKRRDPKERRFFDWRWWVSLTMFLMVMWIIWTGIEAQRESAAKSKRIDQLISEVRQQDTEAQADTSAFAENQRMMLVYIKTLATRSQRQDQNTVALLAYLRAHGVAVPERFLMVLPDVPAPVLKPIPVRHRPNLGGGPSGAPGGSGSGSGGSGGSPGGSGGSGGGLLGSLLNGVGGLVNRVGGLVKGVVG